MALYRLAAIIESSSKSEEFLFLRQTPPPQLLEEEYSNYVDSDLWDLPSAPLNPLDEESPFSCHIDGADSYADKLNLRMLDLDSALDQVKSLFGLLSSADNFV